MSNSAIVLIRGWDLSRFSLVNRCLFLPLSHIGWCRLKSPSQIVCPTCRLSWSMQPVHSLHLIAMMDHLIPCCWVPSLYMLIISTLPLSVCSWIAVMSEELRSICDQVSVTILLLTSTSE